MDPISAIGLLASISSLLKASKGVLDFLKTLKDAEKDLSQLANSVTLFEEALKGFDRVLRSRQAKHNISEEILRNAISEGFTTVRDLEKRLTQVYKTENSALRRMKWVQHKSGFENLDERIKSHCAQLHSFVSLAHMETFLAVCNQHPQLLEACSTMVDEMITEPLNDTSPLPALSKYPSANSSYSASMSLGGTTLSATSSISSGKGSIATSMSSASSHRRNSKSKGSLSESELAILDSDVKEQSLIIRRACRYDCYCKCHTQFTDTSSKSKTRIYRQNNKSKVECTEPDCAAATTSSQKGAIPVSMFKKAMSHLVSANSIKIRYNLNTYRMVPEGSNAMRYVKHGNLEKLKLAIESGEATPWDTAPDGWSLLHTAAYARQLATVEYLVQLGADTETSDLGTRKPVDLAFLKSRGADATKLEKDIVQVFSKDDDYIDDYEFTPIHIAVLDLYEPTDTERPTLERLIEFVDNANNAPAGTKWAHWKIKYQKRSPLYLTIIEQFRATAAENADARKVIHNLVDQKDRKFHWTPLHWASATGQADKMKILIKTGADPFIQSNLNANIIHAAVESNALESLAYSLEIYKRHPKHLNIDQANIWGESALMMAAQRCSVDCVKLLIEAGADRNVRQENQQVALHYAGLSDTGESRRETVALLCKGNGNQTSLDIDAQDEDDRPPIFDFLDDLGCMQMLIDHGARLDLFDTSGNNLLHHLCIQGENEQLSSLLQLYTDMNLLLIQKNQDGNTALIEALRHENVDCAVTLLGRKDIGDAVGQDGMAPIHYAAKMGNVTLLKKVLNHSSFVRGLKTHDGKTARVVAMEAGHWRGEIKSLLTQYNAVI
ncbi:ankyrin repeat protein [Talaromyces proteolyticus]|uniref:Ankyrin repeat protein n=1 Tax=Talaromyces proteolyticus TaxID=1131652 RepID=A0AAD4Q017_9EURO|nr:ankyrin repeat protein [Talaromyces proteolyticus]KAH8700369.1 ankyrin repeat protein [Talaromyces proteolyticus]